MTSIFIGFTKTFWSISDAHAQAERDLDEYLDALIAYTKNIIEHMFDSCTFDVTKTSYTSNMKAVKVINTELNRFEVRTGSSAFLEDVCTY